MTRRLTLHLFALALLLLPGAAWALTATPSTTEGPYYTLSSANLVYATNTAAFTGEAIDNDLTHIYATNTVCSGTQMLLSGTLVNTSGTAISGASIEMWEADNGGIYRYVSSSSGNNNYASRDTKFQGVGKCTTDSSGNWSFTCVKPGLYVGRIRHFHFKVKISGTEYLTSQFMFSEDSASFASDNVAGPLVTAGTMSLVTITPTSGTVNGVSGLIATKQIVVNYTVSVTAPTITTEPVSQSVGVGSNVTFSVVASGTSPFSYQWYKTAAAISGATNSSYSITNVVAGNAGNYYVIVTNSAGSDTSATATLTVTNTTTAPTITTDPTSQSALVGESVSLTVAATGTSPLSYQWYKNAAAISTATNATYSIAVVTTNHAGSYYAVVTNSAGTDTSAIATLTVTEQFTAFMAGYSLSAANSLPNADPDGDGINNVTEFLLGGDPTVADTSILPSASHTTVSGDDALVITFTAAASLGSVTWSVQSTTDLSGSWTTAANGTDGVVVTSTAASATQNLITVTIPSTSSHLFGRLLVTY